MKKVSTFVVLCLAIVACNSKKSNSSHFSQIEQENANVKEFKNEVVDLDYTNIVGDWVWELKKDSMMSENVTSHSCYQIYYSIKADGRMREIEHQSIRLSHKSIGGHQGNKDVVLADYDVSIFNGIWSISRDTLYKEGVLSKQQNGEYKQGQEIPRQESNVKGFTIIKRIAKDSLFVVEKDGGTDYFIRIK